MAWSGDDVIAAVARRQHGNVIRRQLLQLGSPGGDLLSMAKRPAVPGPSMGLRGQRPQPPKETRVITHVIPSLNPQDRGTHDRVRVTSPTRTVLDCDPTLTDGDPTRSEFEADFLVFERPLRPPHADLPPTSAAVRSMLGARCGSAADNLGQQRRRGQCFETRAAVKLDVARL
jgi:hypothetical protein